MSVILIKFINNNTVISPYFVVLLLWYPCFENLFSIVRRLLSNKKTQQADNYHLHHLIYLFFSKKKISYSNNLFHKRSVKDQSGLNAQERRLNLVGAFALEKSVRIYGDIVLIDDVVTTGSTLREARRALSAGGLQVSAAITACVAQPLR